MTDLDLIRVKETYEKLKNIQKKVNEFKKLAQESKIDDMERIRENPEYQDILGQLLQLPRGINIDSDEEILDIASQKIYDGIRSENNTNGIFVYLHSYTFGTAEQEFDIIEVPYDYQGIHWREYRDIESRNADSNTIVYSQFFKEFYDNNQVLFSPTGMDPMQYYQEVRRTFFKAAIESNQKEACKTIYKRYLIPKE